MKSLIGKNEQANYHQRLFLMIKISNSSEIAHHFCDYFSNIGINLAKEIPDSNVAHCTYFTRNYVNSIVLELTMQQELIDSLRPGTAAGYDQLPMSIFKDSIDSITCPLTHNINLSVSSGNVADLMKIARVVPLFKSGDHRLFQNYRPISILPIFSK